MKPIFKAIAAATLPDMGRVLGRFPVAAAFAIVLTLFLFFDLHKADWLAIEIRARVPALLAVGFGWALVVALLAQGRGWSAPWRWGLLGVGLVLLTGAIGLAETADLNLGLLIAALTAAAGIAAFLRPGSRNAGLWQFNHHFWIGALIALAATALFAGGVSAVLESLRYLFGVPIPFWMHEKVWTVALGLVAPLNWLALVPEDIDARVPEGEQSEFTSRAVAMLVRYVLVPLLFVFALILHVYALKILIEWSVPKGRLGGMVLTFGSVLAATAFAAFPTRDSAGAMVRAFWRLWPWLLPVPILLLAIAIWQRIDQYGLTEQRYLVVLAGVWLVSLVVSQGWSIERRDMRWPLGVLAVLFAVTCWGPWGMSGAASRAQTAGVIEGLVAADLVRNGRIIDSPRAEMVLSARDRSRLRSGIDYLGRRGKLERLRPLFAGVSGDPFNVVPDAEVRPGRRGATWPYRWVTYYMSRDRKLAAAIQQRLGLASGRTTRDGRTWVHFSVRQPLHFDVAGKRRVIGRLSASVRRAGANPAKMTVGAQTFAIALENGGLNIVETGSGRFARFDVAAHAELKSVLGAQTSVASVQAAEPLRVARSGGDLDAELILTRVAGQRGGRDEIELRSINFWLSIAR